MYGMNNRRRDPSQHPDLLQRPRYGRGGGGFGGSGGFGSGFGGSEFM